jgi:hypothetical protein
MRTAADSCLISHDLHLRHHSLLELDFYIKQTDGDNYMFNTYSPNFRNDMKNPPHKTDSFMLPQILEFQYLSVHLKIPLPQDRQF